MSERSFSGATLKTVLVCAFVAATLVATTGIAFMMDGEHPKAALVYTQTDGIPDIAFQIASVPLALASFVKYGSGSFALLPASRENLERSFSDFEFVVIGTHGDAGEISSDEKIMVGPPPAPNRKMKFVFFGSCGFGTKRAEWQRSFPNARLIGEDGLAYKHLSALWLFFVSWLDLLKT